MDNNGDEGVTTLDIVFMQWHLLNMGGKLSNYDLIASDVNNSKSLSSLDIAQTREVILHKKTSFGNRKSVEFVSSDYNALPTVFDFDNKTSINPSADREDIDFTAVKLGDANTNWVIHNTHGRLEQLREFEILMEIAQNRGTVIQIPVRTAVSHAILGLQFTLEWNPDMMSYTKNTGGKLHFYANEDFVEEGKLTIMWNSQHPSGETLDKNDILTSMQFERISKTLSADDITITSSLTPALAFDADMQSMKITSKTVLANVPHAQDITIYPNPVNDMLHISSTYDFTTYSILNIKGDVLNTGTRPIDNFISTNHLKKGVYVLQLTDKEHRIINKKFVK
ncbi:MAG: T9SS type A sorting domain-containing protein [Cyclobacteriaceae bacterium]|nr:T9SS type A sorting domain-containing protein [Cyclobacteriaceae bacterium]